jgi:hypothetical protein
MEKEPLWYRVSYNFSTKGKRQRSKKEPLWSRVLYNFPPKEKDIKDNDQKRSHFGPGYCTTFPPKEKDNDQLGSGGIYRLDLKPSPDESWYVHVKSIISTRLNWC